VKPFVGKLDTVDHLFDLITMMEHLPKEYGLVIVGDGRRKAELEAAVTKKVKSKIFFVGRVHNIEVPKYLNAADTLLAPFRYTEGVNNASNLKLFEYMGMAKPIVSSDVGHIKEILKGCGYVAKPGDAKEMAELVQKVKPEGGPKARKKALENFDWRVLGKEIVDTFYTILEQKGVNTKK